MCFQIQRYSACNRCYQWQCFGWGKFTCFIVKYSLSVSALVLRISIFFFHSFNSIFCIIQGWISIVIRFILLADILLHWIRIILCWISAQHLGYSGLIYFHLLLFLRIIFNALWNLPVQWLGVCCFLSRSYVVKWDSKNFGTLIKIFVTRTMHFLI